MWVDLNSYRTYLDYRSLWEMREKSRSRGRGASLRGKERQVESIWVQWSLGSNLGDTFFNLTQQLNWICTCTKVGAQVASKRLNLNYCLAWFSPLLSCFNQFYLSQVSWADSKESKQEKLPCLAIHFSRDAIWEGEVANEEEEEDWKERRRIRRRRRSCNSSLNWFSSINDG